MSTLVNKFALDLEVRLVNNLNSYNISMDRPLKVMMKSIRLRLKLIVYENNDIELHHSIHGKSFQRCLIKLFKIEKAGDSPAHSTQLMLPRI